MKRSIDFVRSWSLALSSLLIAAGSVTAVAADPWSITLGGGIFTRPKFPGSDSNEVRPLPVVDVVYADRWFLHSVEGLGGYLWRDQSWAISVSIAPDLLRRHENDDTRLRGLGNVSETVRGMFGTAYHAGPFSTRFTLASDIGGQGHGTSADLEFQVSQSIARRAQLYLGAGATWTNAQFLQTFFGVNAAQSARSGLAEFTPSSGVTSARLFLGSSYDFRPHWRVGAQAVLGRWLAHAADSPISERTRFCSLAAYLAYEF